MFMESRDPICIMILSRNKEQCILQVELYSCKKSTSTDLIKEERI